MCRCQHHNQLAALSTALVERIVEFVQARGFDGVNLDFEPIPARAADEYVTFVRELRTALDDLERGLGHAPGRVEAHRVDTWRAVIPRYGVGHVERMDALHTALRRAMPGLVPAGTWTGGVAIEDRFKTGLAAANEARRLLTAPREVPA